MYGTYIESCIECISTTFIFLTSFFYNTHPLALPVYHSCFLLFNSVLSFNAIFAFILYLYKYCA
jgi:hypothetical protein